MMKAVVEFGRPQSALPPNAPCGVSGEFVCENPTRASKLVSQLVHVLSGRVDSVKAEDYIVSRSKPRITYWSSLRDCWVTVSILDGANRGAYAPKADKEA
jgi:hypothetical protein